MLLSTPTFRRGFHQFDTMTIRVGDNGAAAPRRVFGRGNNLGFRLTKFFNDAVYRQDAKAKPGGRCRIGFIFARINLKDNAALLADEMLRAAAVTVLIESQPKNLVKLSGLRHIGRANDDQVKKSVRHIATV